MRRRRPLHKAAEMPSYPGRRRRASRRRPLQGGLSRWHCGFPPLHLPPRWRCRRWRARRASPGNPSAPTMPSRSSASRSPARPWSAASAASDYSIDGSIKSAGLATFFGRHHRQDVGLRAHRQGPHDAPTAIPSTMSTATRPRRPNCNSPGAMSSRSSMSPPRPPRRADWVPVGASELAGGRRSAERGADPGEGSAFRLRPHAEGLRRRDPRRPGAELRRLRHRSRSTATRARRSPAAAASCRSPAITAATSRCSTCRRKAGSC